jgi:formate dehydrogenase subunit gamma
VSAALPVAAIERAVSLAVEKTRGEPGPLLEILHAVQRQLGCVPPSAVPMIADALNLSRAEVHGVISFYHHFRETPVARTHVEICRAEACQSMHGRELEAHATKTLGIRPGETTPDGRVTLDAVYCLGLCSCGPALMVNGEPEGRVTTARFDELVREWRS